MGARQKGNAPQYDVASGCTWRPNPTLEPTQAIKLFTAMGALETSASGVINELIARVEFDENGTPIWADTKQPIIPTGDAQGTLVDLADRPTRSQRAA
ncbi:hypothetical protein [Actinoplanes sp. NPDC051851]|uniref:hypothetical protein n=1 Tax=Actinoplanes sp. NPDC051851 TaxID=3154753 RepID=UPI0034466378